MNKIFILLTLLLISLPAFADLIPCKSANFLSCLKMTKQICESTEEKAETKCSPGITAIFKSDGFNMNKLQTYYVSCVNNNFIESTDISQALFKKCIKFPNDNPPRMQVLSPKKNESYNRNKNGLYPRSKSYTQHDKYYNQHDGPCMDSKCTEQKTINRNSYPIPTARDNNKLKVYFKD